MFGWFSRKNKTRYAAGADRAERNAVIKRIVSAAADEGNKRLPPLTPAAGLPPPAGPAAPPPADAAPAPPLTDDDPPPDAVARRAFDIWVRRGRPTGTAEQDWQQAVAELRAERLYRPSDDAP